MKIRKITPNFVCEIYNFDCASKDKNLFNDLSNLLYKYKVVVLKNQEISPELYLETMKMLGKPVLHMLNNLALDSFPEIIKISSYIDENGVNEGVLDGGAYWHSDMSYNDYLGIATALYAIRVSNSGGQTHFVDLVDGLQKLIGNHELTSKIVNEYGLNINDIIVYHQFGNRRKLVDFNAVEQELTNQQWKGMEGVHHQLIEAHPVTNKKSLFAIGGSAFYINGLSESDSVRLLNEIEDFVLDNALSYQHKYSKGDLVIWDNMSTLHAAVDIKATRDITNSRLLYRINVNYNGAIYD